MLYTLVLSSMQARMHDEGPRDSYHYGVESLDQQSLNHVRV